MKNTVRKIAILGMLLAAQVVVGRFVSISLPLVNISFIFLPVTIVGILYGPVWCGISSLVGDFLIAMMGPYGYFPPMAISALATGVINGLFLYKKPANLGRISLCVLTRSILISILLQTYLLTLLTGKGYLVLLPTRLMQNLITIPIQIICIRAFAYRIIDLIPKNALQSVPASTSDGSHQ